MVYKMCTHDNKPDVPLMPEQGQIQETRQPHTNRKKKITRNGAPSFGSDNKQHDRQHGKKKKRKRITFCI
jgi:hypothetical protein